MINADKADRWAHDVRDSVLQYNDWFLSAAPEAFLAAREGCAEKVDAVLSATKQLSDISARGLRADPGSIKVLRMCTAPPIARDRLTGLSATPRGLVAVLEDVGLPPRMSGSTLDVELEKLTDILVSLLDYQLFPWLSEGRRATALELSIASVVVADRLCSAIADPAIRNLQERRQLSVISEWLDERQYVEASHPSARPLRDMPSGTYAKRMNISVTDGSGGRVNIPVDVVVQPHVPLAHGVPVLIEAKSAGDFTNTNKRRKEEATKNRQLRVELGFDVSLLLFLCGYFDVNYLRYEAAEGLDWVWEHRINDLAGAGV